MFLVVNFVRRLFLFLFSFLFSLQCFLLIPANFLGLRKLLIRFLKEKVRPGAVDFFVRHVLQGKIRQGHLENISREKVNVIVANHISTFDFALILQFLQKYPNVYFVFKKEIQWIPGIGQYMSFDDNVMVERQWSKDRFSLEKNLDKFCKNTQGQSHRILVIFPEGTRFCPEKQTLDFVNLLPPKPMGITTILRYLTWHDKMGTFYDLTMSSSGSGSGAGARKMFMEDFLFSEKSIFADVRIFYREIDVSYLSDFTPSFISRVWKEKDSMFF